MASPILCRGCKEVHDPMLRCDVARRRREASNSAVESSRVTLSEPPPAAERVVVHGDVVANKVVVHARTGDRHRKTAERRAYVAQRMRALRARRRVSP